MKKIDLGKKILELRLEKGFTQTELAEKCNVSLRTIQRIESNEVSPRSFTVKTIFSVLDYDFYNIKTTLDHDEKSVDGFEFWLTKSFEYTKNLCNLKKKHH